MSQSKLDMLSQENPMLPPVLPGNLILNGENPFIRLSLENEGPLTTDASLWTITYSPKGAGHALFIKSELTDNKWKIYSDNFKMTRWLQTTVQGMLNPQTSSNDIPLLDAKFSKSGSLTSTWTQKVISGNDKISLVWSDFKQPLLMAHEKPAFLPQRKYGVSLVMIPALKSELFFNKKQALGNSWSCTYDKKPFSTSALAFSESWREK